jgi:hypothetical protein
MMSGAEQDNWTITLTSSYTVKLTDSMTASSSQQQLQVWAESSLNDVNSNLWIWNVNFVNSTFFYYWVNTGGGSGPRGHLDCVNGLVYVVVTSTSIEFIGTSSVTETIPFQNLVQIQTINYGGTFTGGDLVITVSSG